LGVLTVEMDVSLLQATLAKLPEEFVFEDSRSVISSFCGVDMLIGFNWCFGVWWFGSMGSPYKRDCYLGLPRFKSQTNGPQTTNLPVVG